MCQWLAASQLSRVSMLLLLGNDTDCEQGVLVTIGLVLEVSKPFHWTELRNMCVALL